MANLNFAHSEAPLRTIEEVQFGLFSPEEIKNMSVCHIIYPETMDEGKMKPREQGLNDPRLGSIDRQYKCGTCDQNMSECPGHFGHIELAKPVYHPGFIKKVKKILEIVCHSCGKIKLDRTHKGYLAAVNQRSPKRRFDAIWKLCKPKLACESDIPSDEQKNGDEEMQHHGGCGNAQPEVRIVSSLQIMGSWKQQKDEDGEGGTEKDKRPITAEQALIILRNISPEEIYDLGLSNDYARPEWMIITVLPVPPPPVRPSISMDGSGQGMRGEDDLTYKLGDIIRANGNVRQAQEDGSPQHIASEYEILLQYHVATYMDNDIAGQPQALQKSGRPVKSIRARLKGKEGRLRGNLMGKRVDFSARTVITGDPNLSLDEVGVPRSIARTLTYPETVTRFNIDKLHALVENGPNEHPGAKYVIRPDGTRIDLRHHKRSGAITLEYGWKVERHIVDGDFIIFNRQPSLHKESMMGHRVKVMPYSTFRLNLSVTSPYNADFDGDEMNLHVPQSEETRAEVMNLCMVPLNIVSPQKNGPLMGIVQDTLAGIYKMCRRDVFLTKEALMNILLWVPEWDGVVPHPAILKPRPRWSGKQLVSMIIPKIVNLQSLGDSKEWAPLKDDGIMIHEGELLFGLPTKKIVGASGNGIIHIIFNELGSDAAMAFFNGCQRVVNYWLLHNGFSIGIGDTIPDLETIKKISAAIEEKKAAVVDLLRQATDNTLEILPGMNVRETFESKVSKALGEARENAGTATEKALKDSNNAVIMAKSGSKGSTINISQMSALVGQQAVEGKRIPFGFKYRSLPHFCKDDYSPESRGFVENSYLRGLTPTEFYFHAMGGREGLIDTAVKTAETGYIQRRLVKALEDVMAKYDGTVRNSLGDIVEFVYGEDGLDGVHIEKQKVDHFNLSDELFTRLFRIDVMDDQNPLSAEFLEHANDISGDIDVQGHLDQEWDQLNEDRAMLRDVRNSNADSDLQLPLNIDRIINSAKRLFKVDDNHRSDLHPTEVITQVRELLERLIIVSGEDPISQEAQYNATLLFKAQLRSRLAFKRVAVAGRLNKLAFAHVLGELESRFNRSLVNPGEMVGVLAAQSIGEPATQMTLNTFHFAGLSAKNVTLGVPRLKEILNVATNIKTPSMVVYQDGKFDQDSAKALRSAVEHTTLRSVTQETEIYYDPDIMSTTIERDLDMVESYFIIPEDTQDDTSNQSRWLLRITLDRQMMLDKALKVDDVAAKIKDNYPKDMAVIFSDNNADELVIRCRMIMHSDKTEEGEEDVVLKQLESHILDTLTLRGVPGIEKAFLEEGFRLVTLADGSRAANKENDLCKEWSLNTTGIALHKTLCVPGVDAARTYCNSFVQILKVFGIEATRTALMRELTAVLSFDGSYVNHRHIAILVDVMTSRGVLMAVTRHGINRADTGALMRCSFEETVEILLEAAAVGELDDCRGVSENVMLGQLAPMGTGELEVLLDQEMLNTVISNNGRMDLMPGFVQAHDGGAATPYDSGSPLADGGYLGSPDYSASFSPIAASGSATPGGFTTYAPNAGFGAMSPYSGSKSPGYSPSSPFSNSPGSASPAYSASSPAYSPNSPGMALTSPGYALSSPGYSQQSPAFTPTSPAYSPTSPAYGMSSNSPAGYSPTSPSYSPQSPDANGGKQISPSSPNYSPNSPAQYSATSPGYSPTSPQFGGSTKVSPASASSTSPVYSPSSPTWSPNSPTGRGQIRSNTSPGYSPTSPQYSPTSPEFSPNSPEGKGK
ncbi:hypothetical protein BJ878DRAFT_14552 [Calycina marina]|uniref:DNA-directed RNA polymerase subunit n=1 Tax=Calycina marina TaxID=1763456 RepID=A0A9P7Z531_9HELO|nr:hypothetical protein BJ878DRAFT_14552 [Calycina marina]